MKYQKEDKTKSYYENISFTFLKREECAAVAINGVDFKKFTEKFQKPYDNIFIEAMNKVIKKLCGSIPNCILGFSSCFDLVAFFSPPENFETASWYNYDVNRIATYASSLVTFEFNRAFEKTAKNYVMSGRNFDETRKFSAMQGYVSAIDEGALFTAKCFNIKHEQISDYIYLLQKKTIGYAVREMGLLYFKEDQISDKSLSKIQMMVFEKADINFDNYPTAFKHGIFCVKNFKFDGKLIDASYKEDEWVIDDDSPLLKPGSKTYIEKLLGGAHTFV